MKKSRILLFALLLFTVTIFPSTQSTLEKITPSNTVYPRASTDPDFPVTLSNDVALSEYYSPGSDYYYVTGNTTPSQYQVVWVDPVDPGDQFQMWLYSDPSYSDLLAASGGWAVCRLGNGWKLYPTVHVYSGSGDAYIEWEDVAETISVGGYVSSALGASEWLETYQVSLLDGYWYNLSLTVPAGADYAIFVYYLSVGQATSAAYYIENANDGGTSENESLLWKSSHTGAHLIIIQAREGSGTFTLQFSSPEWQYGSEEIPFLSIFMFLAFCPIVLVRLYKKFKCTHDMVGGVSSIHDMDVEGGYASPNPIAFTLRLE